MEKKSAGKNWEHVGQRYEKMMKWLEHPGKDGLKDWNIVENKVTFCGWPIFLGMASINMGQTNLIQPRSGLHRQLGL
jgi:hypothetical protein